MPVYKLRYFNVRGRAEVTRWLFACAGVAYQDIRIESEEWKSMKNDIQEFPFKQMPVLEVAGDNGNRTLIAQSYAVARFVANELGLAGKSSYDNGRCDMIGEQLRDALEELPWRETDPEKKALKMKEAIKGPITEHFKLLENLVQDNGHLVGDGFTLADIHFATTCEFFTPTCPDMLDAVPKLKALNEKVRSSSGIAEWIAKRPDSYI